jgi:hypothetical protein
MKILIQPMGESAAPILRLFQQNPCKMFDIGESNIYIYRADTVAVADWWMIVEAHRRDIGNSGVLILDCSFEGPAYLESSIDKIRSIRDNIRVVILTQNHNFVKKVKLLGDSGLDAVYFHLFIPSIRNGFAPIQFRKSAFRRFIKRKEPHYQESWLATADTIIQRLRGRIPRKYTCLMNRSRPHRLVVFGWLKERGYLDQGNVSMHGADLFEDKARLRRAIDKSYSMFPNFASSIAAFEQSINDFPFKNFVSVEKENFVTSVDVPAYSMAPVSLVTETEMTWGGIQRLTEKTLKAVLAGHRILIAGNPNSCLLVNNMGLRIPGFPTQYDSVPDPEVRLRLVLDAFDRYMAMGESDLKAFFAESWTDCQHNIMEFITVADREIERSWTALASSIENVQQ